MSSRLSGDPRMMRSLVFSLIISLGICIIVSAKSVKIIEKRQICSDNSCNSCQGSNCNTCGNSQNCNRCVSDCNNDCTTASCKKNCVTGCSNICQTQSCSAQTCSQCVNKCSNQCSSSQCVNQCTNNCECKEREKVIVEPEPPIIIEPPQPANVIVNNTNNNLVNLTTHINLNNVVHNYNNISVPVYVNTSNINNIAIIQNDSYSQPIYDRQNSEVVVPYPIPYPIPQPEPQPNCCYVMHPKNCYTEISGNKKCYARRHYECSNSCTSPVISIQESEENTGQQSCHYVRNYPYVYCGNYERHDCGQCYTCNGRYNPSECYRKSSCSNSCKRSISNCVPSQSGLQCY